MEINTLGAYQVPARKNVTGETIFNYALFLSIYERTAGVRPDAQRQWGKMNVVQMLNHLKVATASGLKIYDLKDESSFLWRTIIKFMVIRILRRLPKNARAADGFKIEMNDALDFDNEKQELLNTLKRAYASTGISYPHPLFGQMSRFEWGRLIYRHFDHHLRQFNS